MNTLKMTSAEFSAARRRLGWTPLVTAVEYGVTPEVIQAFENGAAKVPNKIAVDIRYRAAVVARQAALAASGLPECSVREALEQAVFGKKGKELVTASRGVIDHAKACQLCRDRGAYLERHGLVLPERPTSLVARLLRIALTLPDRFPHPIRPPKDETGKGRRSAFFIASIVSASACPVLLLNALSRLIQAGWQSDWWKAVASLGLILPVYFVGFYLAGWIWDVLHPADDQFSSYVLRWSFTGLGIFGSLGLVIPFLDHRHVSLAATLAVVAVLAAGGTLIGAVLWMKDRLWGALAKR